MRPSKRAISLTINLQVQDLLSDIKVIAEQYVSKPNTEIRSSASLEKASLDLFSRYGPILWPDFGDDERPNWLETPSLEKYDGRYPKDLHYSDEPDRQTWVVLFFGCRRPHADMTC